MFVPLFSPVNQWPLHGVHMCDKWLYYRISLDYVPCISTLHACRLVCIHACSDIQMHQYLCGIKSSPDLFQFLDQHATLTKSWEYPQWVQDYLWRGYSDSAWHIYTNSVEPPLCRCSSSARVFCLWTSSSILASWRWAKSSRRTAHVGKEQIPPSRTLSSCCPACCYCTVWTMVINVESCCSISICLTWDLVPWLISCSTHSSSWEV